MAKQATGRVRYEHPPGYDDGYRVGTDGSVWTRKRLGGPPDRARRRDRAGAGRGAAGTWPAAAWRRLSLFPHPTSGTIQVKLSSPGRPARNVSVASLVLRTFVGPPPGGRGRAIHEDDDPTNNRLGNLRWATPVVRRTRRAAPPARPAREKTSGTRRGRRQHGRKP